MNSTIVQETLPIPHIPRKSHNFAGAEYLLPADENERERLFLQHMMLKEVFGEKLVLAPLDLDDIQVVLDSGTGTGIWIRELASKVSPSAMLYGIDIETSLVPPAIPPNISISTNTITKLPCEWTDYFDLVHQRLFLAALRKSEWVAALSEMYRVLRPGGWVQLTESGSVGPLKKSACQEKLAELFQKVFASRGLLLDCAVRLPELLEQAGFCNVTVEKRFVPLGRFGGEIGSIHSRTLCATLRGMKSPVLEAGGFGIIESEEEFDELLDNVHKEWDTNGGGWTMFRTIIAQKPDTKLCLL